MNETVTQWLTWLVGAKAGEVPAGAEAQFGWTHAPHSWGVFVLIGAAAAAVWLVIRLYRREIDTCPPRVKMVLAALRIGVLLVLLAVFLGPSVRFTQERILQPTVMLLRDRSRSMAVRDRYLQDEDVRRVASATGRSPAAIRQQRPSRAELVDELIGDNPRLLEQLARRGKLAVLDFSAEVEEVSLRPATLSDEGEGRSIRSSRGEDPTEPDSLPPLIADGPSTDLQEAIDFALDAKLTAAAILVTDGQHTVEGDLERAAAEARNKGVPLLMLGVGDPQRPRNLVVSDVYADPQVWQDDPFEIQATLRAQGSGGETVEVELLQRQADGREAAAETVLERRQMVLPAADSVLQRLTFEHAAESPGRRAFTVRVTPIDGELSEEDNQPAPVLVKVLSERARVLLIAGAPSWEYRGVQRLLTRERSIDLSCWLQTIDENRDQEGNTRIRRLPASQQELNEYDVVMLLDPDPVEFDDQWIGWLKQFVGEHAGGMLYMAGPKFSGRFLSLPCTRALADLLPVQLGDVAAVEAAMLTASNTRAWQLGVVPANVDQPLMRFFPDPQQSLELWQSLPGVYWSFPNRGPKPVARVLIEHTDPTLPDGRRPLLVTGQYGSGRTVYLGFNGTWRWRRVGQDAEYFNRFWVQTTRYLIEGRSLEGRRRGVIETERFAYALGDRISVTARLKDDRYKPLEREQVEAVLRGPGGTSETVQLLPIEGQAGHYDATVVARRVGRYVLSVELDPAASAERPVIETAFQVTLPSLEMNQVWLDEPRLRQLAETSGGRYFHIDQLEQLAAAIPDHRRTVEMQSQPIPVWDTGGVLALLVILLAAEWAVRKHFKLL